MRTFVPFLLLFGLLGLVMPIEGSAQCTTAISSFPYNQDFESSNGGWVPGGTNADWAWGTPIKPVISGAASGSKCWISGTLTQSFYSSNQNSTLTSPCFNFSGLVNPIIRMKIFWETEKKYDGASFQYSIDGGASWTTLGSQAAAQNCPATNWFNTASITSMGADGWSGNIQPTAACAGGQGGGSGAWKPAEHELFSLAGKTNVRFRFRFSSGSVCNGYDGFAIDDIWIGEATAVPANINYNCSGSNTVLFSTGLIGCGLLYNWNFGDPASGSANTSSLSSPTHVFSGPGVYTVTLTSQSNTAPPSTSTRTVTIIEPTVAVQSTISCYNRKDGSLTVTVVPQGNYSYQWNTTPVQNTATASGLGASNYTVTVSGTDLCPASDFAILTEPADIMQQASLVQPQCATANGSIDITATGGTGTFNYSWTPAVSSSSTAQNLGAGTYFLQLTDARGCTDTASYLLQSLNNLVFSLGNDTTICNGQQLVLRPGITGSYLWQDGSTANTYTVSSTGSYSVTITNSLGCVATDSIRVITDCSDINFPSAFTPNNDGRNDGFGALGNITAVDNYSLRVFNRWGGLVYFTTDPSKKWKGSTGGSDLSTSVFVWMSEYRLKSTGEKKLRKGVVTMVR